MNTFARKGFGMICAGLMIVMIFQNVSAADNVVDVDVFKDYLQVEHKVWRTESNGTYQIHYANSLMQNGTCLDSFGMVIINTIDIVRYPQVALDPISGFCYILWVSGESPDEEFWYCGSIDYLNWTAMRFGCIKPITKGNPTLDMMALNYTLFINWKHGGNTIINPDLDMDLIPDGQDVNPFSYDITAGVSFEADTVVMNHILGVSVAIDYDGTCTEIPSISYVPTPAITPGGGSGFYVDISIESNETFKAIIKISYNSIQLPSNMREKYLCLYYWNDASWMILANRSLKEDTGSDTLNNYVWGITSHFSEYTIAYALNNDCDSDGLNDGEEMNLDKATFAPINQMSDSRTNAIFTFGGGTTSHAIEFNIPDYLATLEYVVDAKLVLNGTGISDSFTVSIDVGNDGIIDWDFTDSTEFNTTTPSLVMAFNEFITTHTDIDDGFEDSNIPTPVMFTSLDEGQLGIAYISILVGMYDSDPTNVDSDQDKLNDGEELNIGRISPTEINTLEYANYEQSCISYSLNNDAPDETISLSSQDIHSMNPCVVYGNDLHAIWLETQYPYQNVTYSKSVDHGASWSIPRCIFSNNLSISSGIDSDSLDIASDGESVGVVLNLLEDSAIGPSLLYSLDNGNNWETKYFVNGYCGYSAIDWQGDTAYIVYRESPPTPPGEYVYKGILFRTFSNGSFVRPIGLFQTCGPYGIPKIAVDGDDIHVLICAPDIRTYPSLSDKALYLHGSVSSGLFSDMYELVSYSVDGIPYTRQSFDLDAKNGMLCYAWQNYDVEQNIYDVWYLTKEGDFAWSTPIKLTSADTDSINPYLRVDQSKNIHFVWQEDISSGEIHYVRVDYDGAGQSEDSIIAPSTYHCTNPCLAVDDNNLPTILWEQSPTGCSEICTLVPKNYLFANIPVHDNSMEYVDSVSMNMAVTKTNADFDDSNEGFRLKFNGTLSTIGWNPEDGNVEFHLDSDDNDDELYAADLGYDLSVGSPDWELTATFAFTDYITDTKGIPLMLYGGPGGDDGAIQFYFADRSWGSPATQCHSRIGAYYYDMGGARRIDIVTDNCIQGDEYILKAGYYDEILTLSICTSDGTTLISGYYEIGSNDGDMFQFSRIGIQSSSFPGPNNGWFEGYIDNILITFPDPPVYIDVGNDGDFWRVGDTGIPITELRSEFNQYLSIHKDSDDGVIDGYVKVPIAIKADYLGELLISEIKINVNILCTSPIYSDTDFDGLGDGEEYNIGGRQGKTISTFYYDGMFQHDLTFDFADQTTHISYVNISVQQDSLTYITGATMNVSWSPNTAEVSDNGNNAIDPIVTHDPTTNEINAYWLDSGIFYHRYFDGTMWYETEPLTTIFDIDYSNLEYAVDSQNQIHAVFEYHPPASGSGIDIGYMVGNMGGWTPLMIIDDGFDEQSYNPSLVIDSNDNVHIIWEYKFHIMGPRSSIYYRACIDNSWNDIILVSDSSTEKSILPTIAIDSQDRIYIAWQDSTPVGTNTNEKIFFRYLEDNAWSPITYPILNKIPKSKSRLFVDDSDDIHIMWDTNNGMLAYNIYSNGTWGTYELVSMAKAETARLLVDSKNNTHLIWTSITNYSDAGTDGDVFYKCKRGGFWTSTELISTYSSGYSIATSVIVQSGLEEEKLWIFYNEQDISTSELVYKNFKCFNRIPGKIILDVGSDDDEQWAPGFTLFPVETTIDFSAELTECMYTSTSEVEGIASIPLEFFTGDCGVLTISNLRVVYDVIVTNPTDRYSDGDALSDEEEFFGRILIRDLNGDGDTSDACEKYLAHSNPAFIDADLDGLFDDVEFNNNSDPLVIDTDYDMVGDWEEFYPGQDKFITNVADVDTDGDHYFDSPDFFPTDPTEWLDTDFDSLGNNYDDNDDDNDGVADILDPFTLNPTGAIDTDRDGKPNIVLTKPWWFTGTILTLDTDDDNDGVPDYRIDLKRDAKMDNDGVYDLGEYDEFPLNKTEWIDTDLDCIGNNDDADDDGDGNDDFGHDGAPGTKGIDDDHDGYIDNGEDRDKDGDVDWSPESYFPSDASTDDPAPYDSSITLNTDGDSIIDDNVDDDDDTPVENVLLGDNVTDDKDAFPRNPTGTVDTDKDGLPDFLILPAPEWFTSMGGQTLKEDDDDDGDGAKDYLDVFPLNKYEWADTDGDGIGDNADPDDDNDGTIDSLDAFPQNPTGIIDTDKDGKPDTLLVATWWTGITLTLDLDDDGDGLLDTAETKTGIYVSPTNTGTDPLLVDSDGDKLTDYEEVMGRTIQIEINNLPGADINYTATSDPTKTNSDNDVLDDYQEKQYGTDPRYEDTDNDGIMDGDELIDEFGGGWMAAGDTDGDGTPNGPTDWDSNGNARSDGLENVVSNFPAPNDPTYSGTADYDGDGLTNRQEHTIDYNPNLDGVQGTSYLTPDSDNDGFWDGADYGLGTSYSLPVKTRLPAGTYTTVWYTVKVVVSMDIQPGEGYLAPASAVGDGKKGTSPLKDDEEKDGTRDGYDIDPLVDLKVTISITEILALDDIDKDPLFGDNPADFFVRISCDMAKWSFLWFESSGYYFIPKRTAEPIKVDDDHLTPDEMADTQFTFNVNDFEEFRTFYIELYDDDGSDDKDDWCDISGGPTVGWDNHPADSSNEDGRTLLLSYSLKTGQWKEDDYPGDPNGYGHVSGTEDGDTRDQDDCELWFDITQNDADGDGLTWWQEVHQYGTDPTEWDTDGDGLCDREALFISDFDPLSWDDSEEDLDSDQLTNAQEINTPFTGGLCSNPLNEDSDDDGISDGEEVFFGKNPIDPSSCQEMWALLIAPFSSADEREFKLNIHEHYELLVQNGWDPTHIRALTRSDMETDLNQVDTDGDGIDDSNWIHADATGGPLGGGNIDDAFKWIIENSDHDDLVFIVLRGHGAHLDFDAPIGGDEDDLWDEHFCIPDGPDLEDDDLSDEYLNPLIYGRLILECDFCYSGGFIEPGITGSNRLIITSQDEDNLSNRYDYQLYRYLDEISADGYIGIGDNSGITDTLISVEEAHYYIASLLTNPSDNNPQISDNIAGDTYLWYQY